ncbi:MAG TPA: TetR/AcrR family transcriptional regulator [Gammaproteobacteria bacterium]|nr:TetR/AcrR family transcriptional regulator [Gammaproteobacteria bacterium]
MGVHDSELSTQDRILNASESLFAEFGFDGVSLRRITQHAGVELALANYHFGPKKDLFLAVIRRRADELNRARVGALDALEPDAEVAEVIDAFTRPFLEKSVRGGSGWKSYARLIAQIANSPRWTEVVMASQFDGVATKFIERTKLALPHSADRNIYWAFHFLLGTMMMTFAETERIDSLSGGRCRSSDLDTIHAKMIPFLAAGFLALCGPDGVGG